MKKRFLAVACLCLHLGLFAQQRDSIQFQIKYNDFKEKIVTSKSPEVLRWMDSLTTLVLNKSEYTYDSIAKRTIRKAISLDSFDIAAKHTSQLLGYYNNYIGEPSLGLQFYDSIGTALIDRMNPLRETSLYIDLGDAYDFTDNDDEAIKLYDKAIATAQEHQLDREEALATLYQGFVFSDNGRFAPAAQNYRKAEIYFENVRDTTRVISIKNSLSILYSANSFFKEAEQFRNEGLALALVGNRTDQMVSFYYNAAADYQKQGLYDKQITVLLKAFELAKQTDRFTYYEPIFLERLVTAYSIMGDLEQAAFYLKDLKKNHKTNSGEDAKTFLEAEKNYAFAKADYNKALSLSKDHLKYLQKNGAYEELSLGELFLSTVYEKLDRPAKALEHYRNGAVIRDSINGIKNVKALTYYQTLYETERRDAEIAAQRSDIEILNAANQQKRILLIAGGIGLLLLFGVISLVRSRNNAKVRRREQERFSQDLLRTQEEERKRIAQDLHDSVGGSLALAKNKLQGLNPTGAMNPQMEEMVRILDTTGEQVRQISHNILPGELVKLGLVPAVSDMVETLSSDQMEVHFYAHKMEERIDAEKEVHLFRVLQEVLHNALKHAKAKNIFINLTKHPDFLNLMIEDDGVGYNTKKEPAGIGIKNIKNRIAFLKGSLQVHSSLGKGTSTTISIPL